MPALEVRSLSAGYDDTNALWDVSLFVESDEIVALIGNNGAGKSSLLGAISGLVRVFSGSVSAGGRVITGCAPDEVVRCGVAQVPQGRRLFGGLTVHENLLMGAYLRDDANAIKDDLARVLDMFPRLKERYDFLAGRLSGGEQQMVAIARALMAKPDVLLIDEMSLGLAPVLVEQLVERLQTVNRSGVAILLVEQDVQTALEFSHRAYVLETGHVVLSGKSADLLDDPQIKKAYLGL